MIIRRTNPAVAILLLGMASSQSSGQVVNQLINPDFDDDLTGWTITDSRPGSVYHDNCFGSPIAGALVLESLADQLTEQFAQAQQCIDVSNLDVLGIELRAFRASEVDSGTHEIQLHVFDGSDCLGSNVMNASIDTLPATIKDDTCAPGFTLWTQVQKVIPLPANAMSALLVVRTSVGMDGNSVYYIDHVYAGEPDTLFRDGFEGL